MMKKIQIFAALSVITLLAAACGGETPQNGTATASSAGGNIQINGAGATFPYPIYSKWFSDYNKLHSNVQINYQSIGSGGGIRQLSNQTVFFGATDGPMTDEQLKSAPGPILHFPTVLGGVVPIYNVEGAPDLKFSGAVLANIFLGKITKWSDPAIGQLNPGVKLPNTDITIVHRSDGSGTNYIFCDYLSKVSPEFKSKVGVGTSVQWPAGVGAKGNEGVAGMVRQTPAAIGYVEMIYAAQNNIAFASVQNANGEFVKASTESLTAAASGAAANMPADFRVSITNAPGAGVYPIASFTWLLLYEQPKEKDKAKVMVDFLQWALTDGQKSAAALGYAPLPDTVVNLEKEAVKKIRL